MKHTAFKHAFHYVFFLLAGFLLFNFIWYITALWIDIKALPLPIEVYTDYSTALHNDIASHILASLRRMLTGLFISLVIALLVGIAMGYNRTINKFLSPLIYFSYPLPKLAFLPIVMILFGIDDVSKIIIIVLIIVFQLTITIRDAVIHIPRENYYVLISLHATAWQKIIHITLPAILPDIFSSLRIASGIALSALFFTETFGTDKGLGFYITDCWMRIDYIQMFFGIVVLSLLGLMLFVLLDIGEKITSRWKNIQ